MSDKPQPNNVSVVLPDAVIEVNPEIKVAEDPILP